MKIRVEPKCEITLQIGRWVGALDHCYHVWIMMVMIILCSKKAMKRKLIEWQRTRTEKYGASKTKLAKLRKHISGGEG